jgi:hypothetical protein
MQKLYATGYGALWILLLMSTAGCGTTEGARNAGSGDRNRITAEQVEQAAERYNSAYGIIENLRPLWLRKRGRSSIMNESDIAVYVDGSRYGTPSDLRSISAMSVESLRFFPPAEATNRFGTGHVHGIIMVYTKR